MCITSVAYHNQIYDLSILIWGIQAPFDGSSVDNMRRLVEHSGPPGHIYPLAILCHDIMPPPLKVWCSCLGDPFLIIFTLLLLRKCNLQVEKEIGEKRVITFNGAGLSVAPEISFSQTTSACENPENVSWIWSLELPLALITKFLIFPLTLLRLSSEKSAIVFLLSLN